MSGIAKTKREQARNGASTMTKRDIRKKQEKLAAVAKKEESDENVPVVVKSTWGKDNNNVSVYSNRYNCVVYVEPFKFQKGGNVLHYQRRIPARYRPRHDVKQVIPLYVSDQEVFGILTLSPHGYLSISKPESEEGTQGSCCGISLHYVYATTQ